MTWQVVYTALPAPQPAEDVMLKAAESSFAAAEPNPLADVDLKKDESDESVNNDISNDPFDSGLTNQEKESDLYPLTPIKSTANTGPMAEDILKQACKK